MYSGYRSTSPPLIRLVAVRSFSLFHQRRLSATSDRKGAIIPRSTLSTPSSAFSSPRWITPEIPAPGSPSPTSAAHSPWVYVILSTDRYLPSHTDSVPRQAIGGTLWHGIKGYRNSPLGSRLPGSLTAIKARAPVLGGNFGVWGGLFGTFDCAVKGIRKKEDPYNAIIAGFFTGGSLAIRGGLKAARNSAIGCACLLAVIEGVALGMQRMMADQTRLDVSDHHNDSPKIWSDGFINSDLLS